jgi:hypothetical protein
VHPACSAQVSLAFFICCCTAVCAYFVKTAYFEN